MGTNYYIKKKRVFKPEDVTTLTNGYVFNNTYFKTARELEFEKVIHVGKCSSGWCFLMHGYEEENIHKMDDFKKYIDEGFILYDESGLALDFDTFIEFMLGRTDMITSSGKDTGYAAVDKRYGLLRHNDTEHAEEPYDITYGDFS